MSVSFDSDFEEAFNAPASPASFVSNAGTVAGSVGSNSNRILIAHLSSFVSAITSPAITWGGTSMTLINSFGSGNLNVWMFGLIAPATGAQTISASWTGVAGDYVTLGAISLFNADQVTGWQNSGTDTATSTTASSTITSANGNMGIICHHNDNASSTTINSPALGWTETVSNGNAAEAYNPSSGATVTITVALGSSVHWANVKVDVIAAAAADTLFGQASL